MAVEFSQRSKERFVEILTRYPEKRAAIMPTLWLAQKEFGYLSEETLVYIAGLLDLSPAFVASVASFYTMYYKKPMGRHHVQVCTNLSCALVGSGEILACLEQRLGISPGETTADGLFTFETVNCLGACALAPLVVIDDDYYGKMDQSKVGRIMAEVKDKA